MPESSVSGIGTEVAQPARFQAFTNEKVVNALALEWNTAICSSSPSRLMEIAVDPHRQGRKQWDA